MSAMKFRAVRGGSYTPAGAKVERNFEPGDVLDDIPAKSLGIYLAQGDVAPVEDKPKEPEPSPVSVTGPPKP